MNNDLKAFNEVLKICNLTMTDAEFKILNAHQQLQTDIRLARASGITLAEWYARLEASKLESRRAGAKQADALIDAGWKFELPEIVNRKEGELASINESELWQWYWRAPVKGKRKQGRKYWSTNQAFMALQRQKASLTTNL